MGYIRALWGKLSRATQCIKQQKGNRLK